MRSAITGGATSVILDAGGPRYLRRRRIDGRYAHAGARSAGRAGHPAPRRDGLILFDVVKLVIPGVAFGLLIAAAIVRLNGNNLGIQLTNAKPLAYVAGAAVAVLVAVLASLSHARRAASVQPMVAMRSL